MKRYNIWDECESLTGDMIMFTDHEAERKELYETIDSNSKKIIKLTEQKKEMLEVLHRIIKNWHDDETLAIEENKPMDVIRMMNIIEAENLIEKVEGEQNG